MINNSHDSNSLSTYITLVLNTYLHIKASGKNEIAAHHIHLRLYIATCIKAHTPNSSSANHNCWRESRDDNSTLQLNENSIHLLVEAHTVVASIAN